MRLYCESCRGRISAADVDLSAGLAKCRICDSVFRLPPELAPWAPPAAAPAPAVPESPPPAIPVAAAASPLRADDGEEDDAREGAGTRRMLPKPAGVQLLVGSGGIVLERRWFGGATLFMIPFTLFWCGFLVVWYGIAFSSESPDPMMVLFPLIHVGVGVWLLYGTTANLLNRTRVVLGGGMLQVAHGPVPWPGARRLPLAAVEQLYCDEVVVRHKNGSSRTYRLNAILRDGRTLPLLKGINERDATLFMEKKMEEYMGLEDRRVVGEVPH